MLWDKKAAPVLSERTSSDAIPLNDSTPPKNGSYGRAAAPAGSVLGPSIRIKGELRLNEELLIEGQFDGNLQVHDQRVVIGPQATVKSDIEAREAVVHGKVHGNISAQERIEIGETGHVTGDVVAPSILIESGAYYKGKIEILTQETKEPTP